ncbi:MAG: diacylglycerol kinase family lipid kinase [Chloroflexi bacterium]|nr:diacylglycerol kinase family lipid kinase [Chloroflexota bacterium]
MRERPRAYAIVNPAAGHGRGARLARTIGAEFEAAGMTLEVAVSPGPGEAARLASGAVDDGHTVVLAVGGDGTANEVANGMVGGAAALALYPIGSGNDLARSLGYPRGRARRRIAQWLATEARRRTIDVGEVNGRIFLNAAGIGIDGHVAERVVAAERVIGPRWAAYLIGSVISIATYRPQRMEVRIDGETQLGDFLTIVASNGRFFGSGMQPAPRARLDDGMLDVTVAGDLSRLQSLGALARLYFGKHENGTTIVTRTARRVEIDLPRTLPMELDGEVGHVDHLRIAVRPGALDVMAAPVP